MARACRNAPGTYKARVIGRANKIHCRDAFWSDHVGEPAWGRRYGRLKPCSRWRRKTAERLRDMNITTVAGLRLLPRGLLRAMFGRRGEVLHERCRGRDAGGMEFRPAPPRTISRETTFHRPTCDPAEIRGMLFYLLERALRAVRQARLLAGCVALNIRYEDGRDFCAARRAPASARYGPYVVAGKVAQQYGAITISAEGISLHPPSGLLVA